MRPPVRLVLALGVLGVAIAGCLDFGSVSGGAGDGGSGSGGGGDSGSATDGPPSSGDGSSGSFCAMVSPAPTFCADFDEGSALTGWTQILQENGSVTIDTTNSFSHPGALLAESASAASGQVTEDDVLKALSSYQGQAIQISASFEMYVEQWDPSTSGQIIAFEVIFKNSSAQFNQIAMNLNSLGTSGGVSAQIAENAQGPDGGVSGYNSYPFPMSPPTGSWTKVEIQLTIAAPTATAGNQITVTVGGQPQLTQQALSVPIQGGPPVLHLGIGYVGAPYGAWAVRYDNFVLNVSGV